MTVKTCLLLLPGRRRFIGLFSCEQPDAPHPGLPVYLHAGRKASSRVRYQAGKPCCLAGTTIRSM
jgi:hypothetical protein